MKKYSTQIALFLSLGLISASLNSHSDEGIKKEKLAHQLNLLRVEALAELDTHHYLKAEQLLKEILKLEPKRWLDEEEYNELLLLLAQTELFLGKWDQAKRQLDQLLEEGLTKNVLYKREMIKAQVLDQEGQRYLALKTLNDLQGQLELSLWEILDQRYYLQLKTQVESDIEVRYRQAESCFESNHYQEALALYEEVLFAVEHNVYAQDPKNKWAYQIQIKMANCCLQLKEYKKAQKLFLQAKDRFLAFFDAESFYSLILVTKKLEEYSKGIEYCKEFLSSGFSKNKQQQVKLEMGQFYLLLNEKRQAQLVFETLLNELEDPLQLALVKLGLAKIALADKEFNKVIDLIEKLPFIDPLTNVEKNYLYGMACYSLGQHERAKQLLKEAISISETPLSLKERQQGQYVVGNVCLKLAQDNLASPKVQEKELKEAKEIFKQLYKQDPSDYLILAFGRALLLGHQLANDATCQAEFEKLYASATFQSLEGELEMGLIKIEWETDSFKKAQMYQKLTSKYYESAKNIGKVWYNRGVFYSQLNQKESKQKALESFIQSYHSFKGQSPKQACQAIDNWVELQIREKEEDAILNAYHNLKAFIEQEKETISQSSQFNSLRCLQAKLCLKMMEKIDAELYFKEALEALNFCVKEEKTFSAQKLFLLARLYQNKKDYAKAKSYYLSLIELYPHYEKNAESLFHIAECARQENADIHEIKRYLKKLFENYPNSSFAPSAYLTYYSEKEYALGLDEPLEHLKQMPDCFKRNKEALQRYYLLGLAYKHKASIALKAKQTEFYNQSLECLVHLKDALEKLDLSKESDLISLYYQTSLLLGQVYLESANLLKENSRLIYIEKAIDLLKQILTKFDKLKIEPDWRSQAQFYLGLAYSQKGSFALAVKTWRSLIEDCQQKDIYKGEILEKAYLELSQIAVAKGHIDEALKDLEQAELVRVHQEQNDEIALQQSYCHRLLKQYDQAEIYLSKVINNGNSSRLKAKAMYLRAEIYKLQGKKDLAVKQLEIVADQKNEWARLAQAKLVKDYGRN